MKYQKFPQMVLLFMVLHIQVAYSQIVSPGVVASGGVVLYSSMVLDNNGLPYIAYSDQTTGGNSKATVRRDSAGYWVLVGSKAFSAYIANGVNIALDRKNTPYVVYSDGSKNYRVTVKKYSNGAWQTIGTTGFTKCRDFFPSVAIDTAGVPYVAYTDSSLGYKVNVAKFNGSTWVPLSTAGISSAYTGDAVIKFDQNNKLYVVYSDGGAGNALTVNMYDGSHWSTLGTAGFTPGGANYPSLTIDKFGKVYVSFRDLMHRGCASVMKFDSSKWSMVGNPGFSYYPAIYTDIATDTNGVPYIIYGDFCANVKSFVNGSWVTVGKQDINSTYASNNKIAFNKSNRPVISYHDGGSLTVGGVIYSNFCAVFRYNGTYWTGMPSGGGISIAKKMKDRFVINQDTTTITSGGINHFPGLADSVPVKVYTVKNSKMQVYPNPCSGILTISTVWDTISTTFKNMDIFNAYGMLVYRRSYLSNLQNDDQYLDTHSLGQGCYVITLYNERQQFKSKLMVGP